MARMLGPKVTEEGCRVSIRSLKGALLCLITLVESLGWEEGLRGAMPRPRMRMARSAMKGIRIVRLASRDEGFLYIRRSVR